VVNTQRAKKKINRLGKGKKGEKKRKRRGGKIIKKKKRHQLVNLRFWVQEKKGPRRCKEKEKKKGNSLGGG